MQLDFPVPGPAPAAPAPVETVIVTPPDQLDERSLIPYESTDRTPAGPLQQLETAAADYLGCDPRQLVSREGDLIGPAAACLFQTLPYLGANVDEATGWIVIAHRPDVPTPTRIRTRLTEELAREAYEEALQWLAR